MHAKTLLIMAAVSKPQKNGDCQLDCHAGGLWRILLNRIGTIGLDLNTEWTLVGLYEHLDSALENCYRCKPIQGSNPCPSAPFRVRA
jgi:hypothetical protein